MEDDLYAEDLSCEEQLEHFGIECEDDDNTDHYRPADTMWDDETEEDEDE